MGAMCTNVLLVPHVQFLYMTMDLNIYINMFLISEMSEFDPRGGGGQNSSKMFDIQNFSILQGEGEGLIENSSQFFSF